MGEIIRGELARLLSRGMDDAELSWVTISGVDVSADLKHARVHYVVTAPGDAKRVASRLSRVSAFLQREVGRTLELKYTPRLSFVHDPSFDHAQQMDTLIAEARHEDAAREVGHDDVARLARLVSDAGRILVACHRNPDGDAIGSLLAMAGILRLMGKRYVAFLPDRLPAILEFLVPPHEPVATLEADDRFDLTILLDTADATLLPEGFPSAERRGQLVVIDHHLLHDDLGDLVIRREVSAVGELLHDLAREAGWPLDRQVAQCLYTSIVSDTGSFRYASTTAHTLQVASDLVAIGAEPWRVATALFESFSLARQHLLGAVASTLELSAGGRFADLVCTQETMQRLGAERAELEGMVNIGRAVAGVEIAAMLRVEPNGDIRVSFRSKGDLDVARLAARFGGGGHLNAAGATIKGLPLDEARARLRAAALEVLEAVAAGERS